MKTLTKFFTPFSNPSKSEMAMLGVVQLIVLLIFWQFIGITFMPKPTEIISAWFKLIQEESLIAEVMTSTWLCLKSIFFATVISAVLGYLSKIPVTKFIGLFVTKGRFLPVVGLSFFFIVMFPNELKVALLTFLITVFLATSFIAHIEKMNNEDFMLAQSTKLGPWRTLYELIIHGEFPSLLEIVRQNFAIAWTALTLVEGISRVDGGIGVMLLNSNKGFHLDAIFAIQVTVLLIGIGLDYSFRLLKNTICPDVNLGSHK